MKVKVYLKDWFFNAGIIGFLRIIKANKDEFAKTEKNYIEFDSESLKDFSKYYFQYFFDTYNVALRTEKRINQSFEKIENYLLVETTDKKEAKEIKDKIKTEKAYAKQTLKTQLDKIKKIDTKIYEEMQDTISKIDLIKTKDNISEMHEIQNKLINCMKIDFINKRLTMNLFKSVLSKNYFGQKSFLNVVNTALDFEKQEQLMYRDYVSNIVETGFLKNIIENKYNIQELSSNLTIKLQNGILSKEVKKVYEDIQKRYIEKGKTIEDIKKYLKEKVFSTCYMCENDGVITDDYSEGNFVPLAVSSDNMKNFFWNQNSKFPICDVCKLILFCIPAGITSITKVVKENQQGQVVYKEKEIMSFVNYDTSIDELLKTNNNFRDLSRRNDKNPYTDLILNIVEQNKEIGDFQLRNIFIVEFETEYLAFSRMEYFNINRYVSKFLRNYSQLTLNNIKDYKYKLQIVDYMLKNKDIKYIVNDRLREELKKQNPQGFNSYMATLTRLDLNLLKREECMLDENVNKNNAKLRVLYNLGIQIHEELKQKDEENKLNGYTYKMLNSIKSGNKNEFMDMVIRIHMLMKKDISPIFLEIMQESDLDFESIGHSFISGLITNKFNKKEEE